MSDTESDSSSEEILCKPSDLLQDAYERVQPGARGGKGRGEKIAEKSVMNMVGRGAGVPPTAQHAIPKQQLPKSSVTVSQGKGEVAAEKSVMNLVRKAAESPVTPQGRGTPKKEEEPSIMAMLQAGMRSSPVSLETTPTSSGRGRGTPLTGRGSGNGRGQPAPVSSFPDSLPAAPLIPAQPQGGRGRGFPPPATDGRPMAANVLNILKGVEKKVETKPHAATPSAPTPTMHAQAMSPDVANILKGVDKKRASTPYDSPYTPSSQSMTPSTPAQREGFRPYVSREEAIAGVMSGRYVRGTLAVNKKYSSMICFVRNAKQWDDVDILIEGKTDRNRAFHNDVVIVEIRPEDEWKTKDKEKPLTKDAAAVTSVNIRSREEDMKLPKEERSKLPDSRPVCRALAVLKSRNNKEQEDPLINAPKPTMRKDKLMTGRIVHIWKADHQRKHVAKALGPAERKTWVRFASYDDKYPHIEVHRNDIAEHPKLMEKTDQFLVYLELLPEWGERRYFPQARVVKLLGAADQVEVESRAILVQNGTDYTDEFDDDCMSVLPDRVPIPSEAELLKEGRRDMRLGAKHERFVCTIDPATARDLDDALSCHDLGGGHYRVSVHIADVSTFVPFGSALDQEALKRATSVYLVQKVIPMLPRKLCEEYCSLNTLSDKLAFTVEWVMDSRGNIQSEWMGQTVIRNQCKLAYENAQGIIDGTFEPSCLDLEHIAPSRRGWTVEKIKESVKGLWKIAENIRAARHARGALSLNQGRMYFDFQDHNSNTAPKGWHMHETAEANWLVEEFMVMANARVTEKCIEYCPDVALARYHAPPDASRFESLVKALEEQGIRLNVNSGKALSTSLENLARHPQIEAIRALTIRCMMLAKYCCTSESAEHPLSHFALNLPLYTHFTSPIRRYADLVVHRVLKCALEIETLVKQKLREGVAEEDIMVTPDDIRSGHLLLPESDVTDVALRCNTRKEEARKASDQSLVLYYCLYLQSLYKMWEGDGVTQYKEKHRATLTKVQEKSFNIFVESLGLDRELFHDNGGKDQRWVGTNMKNSKQGTMCIQWEDGMFEEATVLHRWEVLVWYKKDSKTLDFVCQLCPPDRSKLIPEAEAAAACPPKAEKK